MQKARRHPFGLRPLVGIQFQVLLTPVSRYFSPFPHGTSSLSVTDEYLALGGGPPEFPPDFTCPVVLGNKARKFTYFYLQGCYLVLLTFPV